MKNLYLTRIQTAAIAQYMRSEVRTISCEKHLRNISHMHTRACVRTHRPAHRPVHTCSSTCAQAGMHACLHICTQLRSTHDHTLHAYMHMCAHMYMCLHTHVKMALQLLGGTVSHTSDGWKFHSSLESCHCTCA